MKTTVVIFLMMTLLPVLSPAQQKMDACCAANTEFMAFMAEDEFIHAHNAPLPYTGAALSGSMIAFSVAGGTNGAAYLAESKKHPNKVILMFHDYWGLNDYNKSEADRISSELGVTVCAIDLFDGKVPANQDEASKAAQSVSADRAKALIAGAIAHFGTQTHFGTIGWCMGGTWSMQAALIAGKQADACVIYYGMPEMDEAKLKDLHAAVIGFFGKKDKWITPKTVSDFELHMKNAGHHPSIFSYDADHAFANPSDPRQNKVAAEDANKHAIDFLKRRLKLY